MSFGAQHSSISASVASKLLGLLPETCGMFVQVFELYTSLHNVTPVTGGRTEGCGVGGGFPAQVDVRSYKSSVSTRSVTVQVLTVIHVSLGRLLCLILTGLTNSGKSGELGPPAGKSSPSVHTGLLESLGIAR